MCRRPSIAPWRRPRPPVDSLNRCRLTTYPQAPGPCRRIVQSVACHVTGGPAQADRDVSMIGGIKAGHMAPGLLTPIIGPTVGRARAPLIRIASLKCLAGPEALRCAPSRGTARTPSSVERGTRRRDTSPNWDPTLWDTSQTAAPFRRCATPPTGRDCGRPKPASCPRLRGLSSDQARQPRRESRRVLGAERSGHPATIPRGRSIGLCL